MMLTQTDRRSSFKGGRTVPFYNKDESLFKDFHSIESRIILARSAIESDRVIPALARMFIRVLESRADKRKRPEREIEALLRETAFLPDLREVQEAMSDMDEIDRLFGNLRAIASSLWKLGLSHIVVSPIVAAVYVFLVPIDARWKWGLFAIGVAWFVTLVLTIKGMIRFHAQRSAFLTALQESQAPCQ